VTNDLLQVAVMRRDRLQSLADICLAMGAKKLQAWPLQSCLQQDNHAVSPCCTTMQMDKKMTLKAFCSISACIYPDRHRWACYCMPPKR
jgi:hypothetical protein